MRVLVAAVEGGKDLEGGSRCRCWEARGEGGREGGNRRVSLGEIFFLRSGLATSKERLQREPRGGGGAGGSSSGNLTKG